MDIPRVVEVYCEKIATAAHSYAHVNRACEFDPELFHDRMKLAIYNTRRQIPKGSLVAATTRPVTAMSIRKATNGSTADNEAPQPDLAIPAPPHPQDEAQQRIAAEAVVEAMNAATNAGRSFANNVRLIRSAVYHRDPKGQNKPLQNALKALLRAVQENDVKETEEAMKVVRAQVDFGKEI